MSNYSNKILPVNGNDPSVDVFVGDNGEKIVAPRMPIHLEIAPHTRALKTRAVCAYIALPIRGRESVTDGWMPDGAA